MASKFAPKIKNNKPIKRTKKSKDKQVEIIRLLPPILARLTKKILEKSKKFKKDYKTKKIAKLSK